MLVFLSLFVNNNTEKFEKVGKNQIKSKKREKERKGETDGFGIRKRKME